MFANRIRFSASALVISGILFVTYPALRPFSDEGSLLGAAAFGSGAWLASHMLAIVAFTLLPLGLLGLQRSLLGTPAERLLFVAVVLSMIGTGFTLPFYGGEAYGLHSLGQEALRQNSASPLGLAEVIRSGPGLAMFLAGLLLLAASAIATATALWRSCRYPKASGVPFASGCPCTFRNSSARSPSALRMDYWSQSAACGWPLVFGGESSWTRRGGYDFPWRCDLCLRKARLALNCRPI